MPESINPWTRIPYRASFEEAFDDSDLGGYTPPKPPEQDPVQMAAPPPETVCQLQPPPAMGSGLWTGEPPPHIPER